MHTANITLKEMRSKDRICLYDVVTAYSPFSIPRTSEAYTRPDEDHMVLRWVSSDNVIPKDIMETAGWAYQDEMNAARDEQQREALERYVEAQANRTPEQIAEQEFEMRAAFGPGETVVDIFTGERTKL